MDIDIGDMGNWLIHSVLSFQSSLDFVMDWINRLILTD